MCIRCKSLIILPQIRSLQVHPVVHWIQADHVSPVDQMLQYRLEVQPVLGFLVGLGCQVTQVGLAVQAGQ